MSAQTSGDRGPENTWDNLEESVKKSVISLRDFARRKEKDFQFVISLSPSELAGFLKDFFLALKEQSALSPSPSEDDNGAVASLGKIRSDLCDYFKKVMSVDITTGSEFSECNLIVDDVAQSQTKDGSVVKNAVMKKHTRQRTFTFETNELRQIYMSEAMNLDQPETLQNKVFFDVCMYICNRGKDFLRLMTKNDFEVSTDQNGRRYVWLKYDPKFSFNEVAGGTSVEAVRGSQIGERMYERPGDPKCTVYSYTQYVIHLHPMSDAFWQRPKRSILPTDFVWYDNQSIGNSTLNRLMNRITQSAGLPDSYAINAIKSSYIPVIESICRSALFGSQQFRRILQIKQSNHDMHYHVRKRHSEGSLSIASVLRESPMFRPRNSEPLLPLYRPLSTDTEVTRSSSTSPVPRGGSWDSGSPHMMPHMTPERKDTPETGYQPYRNCEPDLPSAGYQSSYRDSSPNGAQDLSTSSMSSGPQYHEEERKTMETGTIQQAKQKCLEIVHSLEVRDIKSFINWMKTFEAKHGPSGLMVTCQPVNAGEAQMSPEYARASDSSVANGYTDTIRKPTQRTDSQQKMQVYTDFEAKDLEFDCIGDTFCCTSDVSPVKITIPAQDTVLLTGLQQNTHVLIHKKNDEKQSAIDNKYMPLHMRVLMSSENYNLQDVETVVLKKQKDGPQMAPEITRSNCFKEDKSIPMKKRIVLDQESQNQSSPCNGSPQQAFSQSHSPPSHSFPHHPSPYMAHAGYPPTTGPPGSIGNTAALNYHMAPGPPQMMGSLTQGIPAIPKYRERFPDGWGYTPLQKRQKFGMQHNGNGKDGPLDLIKPS